MLRLSLSPPPLLLQNGAGGRSRMAGISPPLIPILNLLLTTAPPSPEERLCPPSHSFDIHMYTQKKEIREMLVVDVLF
jgi:hypothetical protein